MVDQVVSNTNFIDTLNILVSAVAWLLPMYIMFNMEKIKQLSLRLTVVGREIRKLGLRTGRPVIYINSEINFAVAEKLENALAKFEKENVKKVIIYLHTLGGYGFCMERICNSLKNFKGETDVYIPKYAMSAGSMIAFACTRIHMNKTSSLGAVDPQLGTLFWIYPAKAWEEAAKKKGSKANDETIMMARIGKQYSKMMRAYLDDIKSLEGKDKFKNFITSGDIPHATQFNSKMLEAQGLRIYPIDHEEIETIAQYNNTGVFVFDPNQK